MAALTKLEELACPMLFVCGEYDRLCPGARLKEVLAEGLPDVDARVVVLEVRCAALRVVGRAAWRLLGAAARLREAGWRWAAGGSDGGSAGRRPGGPGVRRAGWGE